MHSELLVFSTLVFRSLELFLVFVFAHFFLAPLNNVPHSLTSFILIEQLNKNGGSR